MKAIKKIAMAIAVVATISFTSCSKSSSASGEGNGEQTIEDKVVELTNKAAEDINAAKSVDELNEIQSKFETQLDELGKNMSKEDIETITRSEKFMSAMQKCEEAFNNKMEELASSYDNDDNNYMSYVDDEEMSLDFDGDYEAAAQEAMQAGMDQYNSAVEAVESQISEYGF